MVSTSTTVTTWPMTALSVSAARLVPVEAASRSAPTRRLPIIMVHPVRAADFALLGPTVGQGLFARESRQQLVNHWGHLRLNACILRKRKTPAVMIDGGADDLIALLEP